LPFFISALKLSDSHAQNKQTEHAKIMLMIIKATFFIFVLPDILLRLYHVTLSEIDNVSFLIRKKYNKIFQLYHIRLPVFFFPIKIRELSQYTYEK